MLAKVSRGVEEFFRADRGFQLDFGESIEHGLAVDAAEIVAALLREIERAASGFETGVATFEESAHVGWNKRVGEAFECRFAFLCLEVKRGGGVEVDDVAFWR